MTANSLRAVFTPMTIGAFLLMAVTGLLMFFHVEQGLNEVVHEWGGLVFVVAAVAHLLGNFTPFKNHLKKAVGAGLVAVFVVVTAASFIPVEDNKGGIRVVVNQLRDVPLAQLAPAAGKSVDDVETALSAFAPVDMHKSINAHAKDDRERAIGMLQAVFAKAE